MKLTKTILALGAVVLAGQAPLALAQKCNDENQVCRDKSGPNVEQTRQRYGDDAARRLERRQSRDDGGAQGGGRPGGGQNAGGNQGGGRPGAGQPPGQGQNPGGGAQGGGRPNPGQNSGGGNQADTFSPGPGISCIRSAQVCYSAGMPNPFHTARHFGPAAAGRISQ